MFEPIPEPSASTDYLKINENEKHRIRIMGTSKNPASFVQGWEAWGNDNKPVRMPYELGKPCPQILKDLCRETEKPKLFWFFTVWHVDLEKPMVYEVTQKTIKDPILAYSNNPAWGDPPNYVLEIGRTGTGNDTIYTVIAEPPVSSSPPQDIVNAMKDAMIDLRVIFMKKDDPKANDGNPFGALGFMPATAPANDQANIQQLREQSKPIPMGGDEESLNSVGSVALDAIANLKAAQAKSTGAVQDDIPY